MIVQWRDSVSIVFFLLKVALFRDMIVEKVVANKEIKPRAIELI